MNIRQQHTRLDCIMQMIIKCDRMVDYCKSIPWNDMANKYIRVRSRLYKAYANQLATMCSKAIGV